MYRIGCIFNKKNIAFNIDTLDTNTNNILYVRGLSGSGKTTLAKRYNYILFELDNLGDFLENINKVMN